MSRVQLAINVSDLEAAVDFYTKLFATGPAKREPGYANFAIADPPLKLVLVEQPASREGGADEVVQTQTRLTAVGLDAQEEMGTTCCFAVQDKVWVEDPDGTPWEVYTVLADAPSQTGIRGDGTGDAARDGAPCC
jgi:Glyoxalase/Bleomycin resistance protein/Dioxygenase superfamily